MGFCWILIHALISLFIVYAIKYPYSGRIVVNYDIIVDWLEDMSYTIREKDWEKIQLWIRNWLNTMIPDLLAFSKAMYQCLILSEDITKMCDWKTRNWIMIAIVLNFVSWPFNVWHHKLYFTFHDTSRIKNWDTFKFLCRAYNFGFSWHALW
ncbi:MAG: hypothetical protein EXX96DRAFT_550368 [Benjaminiella poitrasii]|nr:MAG: hypothetical protein EXX96DRAFT_550368 [Benjaminiella poitrasii]